MYYSTEIMVQIANMCKMTVHRVWAAETAHEVCQLMPDHACITICCCHCTALTKRYCVNVLLYQRTAGNKL